MLQFVQIQPVVAAAVGGAPAAKPKPKTVKKKWFCCAHHKCDKVYDFTSSTSSITDHLRKAHGVLGETPGNVVANAQKTSIAFAREKGEASLGQDRYSALCFAMMVIRRCLSFAFAECRTLRINMHPSYVYESAESVGRHVCEFFLTWVGAMRAAFDTLFAVSALPRIFLSADLWTSKANHKKFLGVRVFWCDQDLQRHTAMIACSLYSPAFHLLRAGMAPSEVLYNYIVAALAYYNIRESEHVLGACADAGSDVKSCFQNYSSGSYDWCIAHCAHIVFTHSFVVEVDACKSLNPECRNAIKDARNVATLFQKSPNAAARLAEIQDENDLKPLVMSSDVSQRWGSLILMLFKLLVLWPHIMPVYEERGEDCPIMGKKPLYIELYSLCHPFIPIFKLPQSRDVCTLVHMWSIMQLEILPLLDTSTPLTIITPTASGGVPVATYTRPEIELHPITRFTRARLAMCWSQKCFLPWAKVDATGKSRSFVCDMLMFLYPPYANEMEWVTAFLGAVHLGHRASNCLWDVGQLRAKITAHVSSCALMLCVHVLA